jgi:CelD/BcsL family acetyltransferase involved in cellulose biosynthesis
MVADKDRLTLDELSTPEDLDKVSAEWSDLLLRSPSATPFQSPGWIITWWKYFGTGRLRALALRSNGRLAGLAPLYITDTGDGQPRELRMMGTGITDYMDLILESGLSRTGTSLIPDHLASTASDWDICDFQELRSDSALLGLPLTKKLHTCRLIQEVCPVLTLPASADAYYGSISPSFVTRIQRAKKALTRSAQVELVEADASTLTRFMDELFRLHGAAWEERNQTGVLSDTAVRSFHNEVAERFMSSGTLRLFGLQYEEKLIAVIYAFFSGSRFFFYIGGHDPEFARLSPGTVLMALVIEKAIDEGVGEIDFLRGSEKYKFNWGARARTNYRLLAWPSRA